MTSGRAEEERVQKANSPLLVLCIEDSEDDALLVANELARGGFAAECGRVETAEAMREALDRQKWDIVISDYVMPQFSGPDALKILKESGQDLPFIIVSGKIGEDIAVDAMKAGAHDYILKGNLARLVPAIKRELSDAETRHQRRMADEALSKAYQELELKVSERTAALSEANRTLQEEVAQRKKAEEERERLIGDLQKALADVKTLSGLLPICASCKKIRDDNGYWNQLEEFIRQHSSAEFTHGLCPDCAQRLYPEFFPPKK